jgi:hypothetical protein
MGIAPDRASIGVGIAADRRRPEPSDEGDTAAPRFTKVRLGEDRRRRATFSQRPAAMLIRVSDLAAVPALLAALNERAHYVVKRQGEDEIAVSVLGSFADGGELELTLFLVAWQKAHPQTAFVKPADSFTR